MKITEYIKALRKDVIEMTTAANSGHPTSCLSCAEIVAYLFFKHMRIDVKNPHNIHNDEFILSKGHAAPIFYAALKYVGAVKEDLLTLRQFGSIYEGHPTPHSLPWAKIATGSLGQGLSVGIGMALAAKYQHRKSRTYVLCGDGEVAEGSIYEALAFAAHHKVDNVTLIVDINKFGLAGPTMYQHSMNTYKKRFESFGWKTIVIDGHDLTQIASAIKRADSAKKPTAILAKTIKGKGVPFLENKPDWHGKVLSKEQAQKALIKINAKSVPAIKIKKPRGRPIHSKKGHLSTTYTISDMVATRVAYGDAIRDLARKDTSLIAIDAEVKHSTFAEKIEEVDANRFIEAFIAEQNLVGVASGLAIKQMNVYASTFAAFFSRAHDQIRIAGMSNTNMTFVGSHAGVSIGEDGPTQMGLEDIALFRAMPNGYVFYPSDAVSTQKITQLCAVLPGPKYIRTSRPKTPVIYPASQTFAPGDFGIIQKSTKDKLVVVAAGVTLHEAIKAAEGLNVAVIDCYSIKPFNDSFFRRFVKRHGNKVLVVEDHYRAGGIGEMIAGVIVNDNIDFVHLCVDKTPQSGSASDLLSYMKIDAQSIKTTIKRMIK